MLDWGLVWKKQVRFALLCKLQNMDDEIQLARDFTSVLNDVVHHVVSNFRGSSLFSLFLTYFLNIRIPLHDIFYVKNTTDSGNVDNFLPVHRSNTQYQNKKGKL